MTNVAKAFDEQSCKNGFRGFSYPAEQDGPRDPWKQLYDGDLPPMMFQLRFRDGSMASYAYSDLREIRCRDAGCVQLYLNAMRSLLITIDGRHLSELANLLSSAQVRWIDEVDPRDEGRPENAAEIVRISVEEIEE